MCEVEVKGNLTTRGELGSFSMSSINLQNPRLPRGPAAMHFECWYLPFYDSSVKLPGITPYSTPLSLSLLFIICSKPGKLDSIHYNSLNILAYIVLVT